MKENTIKALIATVVGGVTAYFGKIAVPLAVLVAVMVTDYLSGLAKAWFSAELSSRTGIKGIVKKVCYLLVVAVAAVTDWLIHKACISLGIAVPGGMYIGVIVTVWLIINECISILENLAVIGVPLPAFLTKFISKLKISVEKQGEEEAK